MRGTIKRTSDGEEMDCFYYPEIFSEVVDLEYAKRLTVSRENNLTSEERWDIETKFTIDTLLRFIDINHRKLVLDYGCGVGRLSKPLIEQTGCLAVGVDISAKMRTLAIEYVNKSNFQSCSSETLRASGMKFDCAIASWVLQHCADPIMDIELIYESLKPKAHFFILENFHRKIPIKVPSDSTLCWMDDGINIRELISKYFYLVEQEEFVIPSGTYWAIYQRK